MQRSAIFLKRQRAQDERNGMYIPPQFREERPEVLAQAMRRIQFATLVTAGPAGLEISHVPMILKDAGGGERILLTHVSRANPHWKAVATQTESVAIFQGPQAYISPSWYATKREHGKVVPTWNYIAVHARGHLEAIEDPAWLHAHVTDLTRANESEREQPWEVTDAPVDYVSAQIRGIVGLRLSVARVEGAWKMIQHRSEGDRLGSIAGLEAEPHGHAVAQVMRELERSRSA